MDVKEEIRNGFVVTEQRKKVWAVELDMLQRLLEVCKKHKIRCWLDSGSLLGAVRHQGFIPWDDDIDVVMLRDDYDKLVEIGPQEFHYPLFFQSVYTDCDYYRGHVQIRNSETMALIPSEYDRSFNQGIFIDVFPLDGLPKNEVDFKKLRCCSLRMREMMYRYHYLNLHSLIGKHFLYNVYIWLISNIIIGFQGKEKFFKGYMNMFRKTRIADSDMLTKLSSFETIYKGIDKHIFDDTEWIPFENIIVPVPKRFDEYLKLMYGNDYMTPVMASSLHGNVIFDTDYSFRDLLPKYRNLLRTKAWKQKVDKMIELFK